MTSILKKHTPSPPGESADSMPATCECRLCIVRLPCEPINKPLTLVDCMYEQKTDTDLEDLIYSLAMLIIEGRYAPSGESYQDHANFVIENLLIKASSLNQISMGSDPKFVVQIARKVSHHSCFNQLSPQCRIASRLKEKIEKCIQDHTNIAEEIETDLTESQEYQEHQKIHAPFLQQLKLATGLSYNDSDTTRNQNTATYITQAKQNLKSSSISLITGPVYFNTCTKITVSVYLLPSCCFNESLARSGDHLLDTASFNDTETRSSELLECWTISMVKSQQQQQRNEPVNRVKLLTLNELFQAIRSYLHFSQISSWINQSNGQQPKNIAYSFKYSTTVQSASGPQPSESGTTTSSKNFDFQTFPTLNLFLANNKFHINTQQGASQHQPTSTQLRVSLLSRKRTPSFKPPRLATCPVHNDLSSNMISTTSATQPIPFSNKEPSNAHNLQNIKNNLLLLPQTSLAETSTPDSTPPRTSFLLTPQTSGSQAFKFSPLALNLFQSQANSPSTSTETTPSSFFNSRQSAPLLFSDMSDSSGCCFNNSLISQSPKVLVSNHQLVTDLCSFTQNQLRINITATTINQEDESTNSNNASTSSSNDSNVNKRKFLHECDSVVQARSDQNYAESQFEQPDLPPTTFHESHHSTTNIASSTHNTTNQEPKQTPNAEINNNTSSSSSDPFPLTKPRKLTKLSECQFSRSNLPLSSSPAPCRKSGSLLFDFDNTLKNPRSIRNALTSSNEGPEDEAGFKSSTEALNKQQKNLKRSTFATYTNSLKSFSMQMGFSNSSPALCSMPIAPSCLLGSFEESLLNGRMKPAGVVDGFYAEIGASGSFFPEHVIIPVHAAFYQVCEDIAASPYLGVIDLGSIGKRGYKVPNKGTIQVTLFNPNKTVVKMFVVLYDLSDMPPGHRTFLRQRTMYVPLVASSTNTSNNSVHSIKPVSVANGQGENISSKNRTIDRSNQLDEADGELKSYLRYLIHLRFATSKSGKMYLHTNIKLIFARNKCEIDPRLAKYEYKTFTEAPKNPRYSPKK